MHQFNQLYLSFQNYSFIQNTASKRYQEEACNYFSTLKNSNDKIFSQSDLKFMKMVVIFQNNAFIYLNFIKG